RLGVLRDLDDDVDFVRGIFPGGDVVETHGTATPAARAKARMVGKRNSTRPMLHCRNSLVAAPARVLGSARGRVRPSCAPSIRPRTYGVRPPPQRDAPMSITDASRIADAALPQSESYWDNPEVDSNRLASPGDLDLDPVDPGQVERSPLMSLLTRSGATEIDGSRSNPADRSLGQTPDGKTIQVDTLHRDGDVQIARERTLGDAGGGQTYVSADQLVITTGGTSDRVGVSQRDDGTLDVSVNGESFAVKAAEGQELTLRTGGGDDVIEVAANVTVNIVADTGAGDDQVDIAGSGDNRIDA